MLKSFFTGLTRLSLHFKWVTISIALLLLVGGVFAASQLNKELLPNIEFPQTFIVTLRPGASSEDLRDLVTKPLENEVLKIKGVIPEGLESTTTSPVSFLTVRNQYGIGQEAMRELIKAAIVKVSADDVPLGLKTTTDLTPDVMRKVLTRAPSMWKHFDGSQILAMSPNVLNAALAINPDFVNQIDLPTRDQLAAQRVDAQVNGAASQSQAVDLPSAWALTDKQQASTIAFDLGSIPVVTASIFSTSPDMNSQALQDFVNKKLLTELDGSKIPGLAKVSISGGQQIPQDVYDAAIASVKRSQDQASQTSAATAPTTTTTTTQPTTTSTATDTGPALPASWRSILNLVLLRATLGPAMQFDSADNLLNTTATDGSKQTAASLINKLAASPNVALLRDLTPDVVSYWRSKESDFDTTLSDAAREALAADTFNTSTWTGLLKQPGFQKASISSLADLAKIKGGIADTLNAIVASTPKEFNSFAIRLVSSLSQETVAYLLMQDSDFLSKLSPQTLRYLSSETLKSIPTSTIDALKDDTLKTDLKAIIADPKKEAVAALGDSGTVQDDPNAPPLPDSLIQGLKSYGVIAKNANDLMKKPFGMTPGAFVNTVAGQSGNILKQLSPEALLYLQGKDPTFLDTLTPTTLGALDPVTLAKLPPAVQSRAQSGPAFTPTNTITRTNSRDSLTLAIYKDSGANTVNVADGVTAAFAKIQAENPTIQISTIFEQASFIKESIDGVAREGGLGAVMAVVVILLFLNFSIRSTLVTAVSIPTSVAIALILMRYVPGQLHQFLSQPSISNALPDSLRIVLLRLFPTSITLNIMTLSGLTVAIGRVVDDSIVVLENIYTQIQRGVAQREAVIQGTRDVSAAIFAATLTTVVVFLPIGLAGGVVGEIFLPFGLAVTYSLIASFVVAVTIVPVLAFLLIKPTGQPHSKEGRLETSYQRLIVWALDHRWLVLSVAMITLVFGVWLFSTRPATFLPSFGEPQISVTVSMPAGTKIAQTDVRVHALEDYLQTLTDKGVKKYQIQIGSGGGLAALFGGGSITESAAAVTVAVSVPNPEALTTLTQNVRAKAEDIFGTKNVQVSKATLSDQGFGGFALVISGPEAELSAINDKVIATLNGVKGLANVTSTQSLVGGASAFLRINQTAAVQFTGELETQNTLGVTTDAITAVKAIPGLPSDLVVGEGFQSQQQTEGFAQTFSSMGIAIVIVYIVMVLTFGSLIHPFTILFTLPLAIVGAALGLTITNRVLGISALIGLLMLIGIVVTNAIVMLDRVQANRKERGMSTRDALIEGGRTRLRPILMTAIATMFALLPLASGLSQGAIIASELGTVVIGGLFSSTLLTLLVVPVVYSLFDRLQDIILRRPAQASKPTSGD